MITYGHKQETCVTRAQGRRGGVCRAVGVEAQRRRVWRAAWSSAAPRAGLSGLCWVHQQA